MSNFFVSYATFLFVDRLTSRKEYEYFEVCSLWRCYSEGVICWQIRMWRLDGAEFADREGFLAEGAVKAFVNRIERRLDLLYWNVLSLKWDVQNSGWMCGCEIFGDWFWVLRRESSSTLFLLTCLIKARVRIFEMMFFRRVISWVVSWVIVMWNSKAIKLLKLRAKKNSWKGYSKLSSCPLELSRRIKVF